MFQMNSQQESSGCYVDLRNKLESRQAVIGIIGLGYVGLPLVSAIHGAGFQVIGFDIDDGKIKKLQAGASYIHHIDTHVVRNLAASERFIATSDFQRLKPCDVFILCLPTPVGSHNEPDMSYVLETTQRISTVMKRATLIVLESTTYPGATDTDMVTILKQSGFALGEEFFVAYSPEREDPGNEKYTTQNIAKLLGGVDDKSGELVEILYNKAGFENTVRVSSSRVAECAKLLENTYRAVNIALVNELKGVFESMDVDIWEVLQAAATKPFGFQRFNPGPGIGGHCIPVDPFYLTWKGKETGASCTFIELAAAVNARMPFLVVDKVKDALNDRCKSVKGSHILLVGVAYKPNVDDIREAPALVIWDKLLDLQAKVSYVDPFVPVICATRKHPRLTGERSVSMDDSFHFDAYDAMIVVTNHSKFEGFEFLHGFPGPVVDTRNCISPHVNVAVIRA